MYLFVRTYLYGVVRNEEKRKFANIYVLGNATVYYYLPIYVLRAYFIKPYSVHNLGHPFLFVLFVMLPLYYSIL